MSRAWASRFFFSVVAVMALAALISGTACTRWGQPGAVPPTLTPLSSIYVNPKIGSDTSGNGSQTKPYRTFTKAVDVLATSKSLSSTGVTINLSNGDYTAANGEKFPIVIPTAVSIVGMNFGTSTRNGTFIDGFGQDTLYEQLAHAPARSAYTTLEIAPAILVSISDVYVGASKLKLPSSRAAYWSLDVLGSLNAGLSNFGSGTVSKAPSVSGVLLAGGTLSCSSCEIQGNDFGIGAFSVTVPASTSYPTVSPSSSPTSTPTGAPSAPSVTLTHSGGDSTISAKVVDLITDASVDVSVSGERFQGAKYAFNDSYPPIIHIPFHGAVDFGGGFSGSSGGNNFIGARLSEISLIRRNETVTALDDTWNASQQGASRSGTYGKMKVFGAGASGKNVTILPDARGSTVTVGPAVVPTPTPSAYPSTTPSPTP
jgi:Protein of unknown function (DUF1565)